MIYDLSTIQQVVYQEFPAYNNTPECIVSDGHWGEDCTLDYTLDHTFEPPIYFHYKLTKFYQNHRRYVKSQSTEQIQNSGDLLDPASYRFCTPSAVTKS